MTRTPPLASLLRDRVLPVVVAAVVLVPNVWVIARGVEDFPFTVAPMFAHYVDADTRLYAFRFEGVRGEGTGRDGSARERSEPLPIERTGHSEVELMRYFASFVYAPLDETAPFRQLDPADAAPDRLAERMSGFIGALADRLRAGGEAYDRVDVYVDAVDGTGAPLGTALVGRYDTATRQYTHSYGAAS
ncbi:hypothetical protein [Microbacterium marinilacus]|uniref:Uncharacterized protein n=1 Tax=Microbacterium marinilacus TaxID=415209 RepID=A0ABP7BPF6_9MICO|nr:hypothetical protein [Microbacterium marinilacus]MBY0690053.1 hypothetical protein [Microbacterium marinilacus]